MPDLTNRFLEGNGTGYIETGLPNITGTFGNSWATDRGIFEKFAGAFYSNTKPGYLTNIAKSSASDNPSSVVGFNASRSSSIYGNSNTVQPATCKCYFVIKY